MTIPDAAIEAAAEASWAVISPSAQWDRAFESSRQVHRQIARAAIEAAMPAIREAIAQEIEADPDYRPHDVGMRVAVRIVRGGAA